MFYTYKILGEGGELIYIGKGTGARLQKQMRRFQSSGEIIARYSTERQAYMAEKALIAEIKPPLNRCSGGGGGIFGLSHPRIDEDAIFRVSARIIKTLQHYKQIRRFKVDLRAALEKFVADMATKYGPEEFGRRLLPHGVLVSYREELSLVTAQ